MPKKGAGPFIGLSVALTKNAHPSPTSFMIHTNYKMISEHSTSSTAMKGGQKSPKRVQFSSFAVIIPIEPVRPDERHQVYGPPRPDLRSLLNVSTLYDLNLTKLLMEVHPESRKNTQFYRLPDERLTRKLIQHCQQLSNEGC